MLQLTTLPALRQWRFAQEAIALVPTMGALHAGHQALIEKALTLTPTVIVSIFVNPTQFGPQEDLSRYPRPLDADLALCRDLGVSAVYTPDPAFMFPQGLQTAVTPPAWLTDAYCGLSRPGHFTGVATVVLKLFLLTQPQFAVFGTKDAQQLAVINRMVNDLNLPVDVVPVNTVREADGLALSSRNAYLTTPSSRQAALTLIHTLKTIDKWVQTEGPITGQQTLLDVQALVLEEATRNLPTRVQWEYLNAVDPDTFEPVSTIQKGVLLLGAIRLEESPDIQVRLIDNWLIG